MDSGDLVILAVIAVAAIGVAGLLVPTWNYFTENIRKTKQTINEKKQAKLQKEQQEMQRKQEQEKKLKESEGNIRNLQQYKHDEQARVSKVRSGIIITSSSAYY